MPRITVDISDDLKALIDRPEELGLEAFPSQSSRLAALAEEAADLRRARKREAVRDAAYVAYAADPEHLEAAEEVFALGLQDGLAGTR